MTVILSILNRLKKFTGNFAVKWIAKIPPHLAYVATLPRETLTSAKQAIKTIKIKDKLQGSVATYLRCGWVVNNQIKKDLLPTLRVKKNLKSVNNWQSYKQERDSLVHLCARPTHC